MQCFAAEKFDILPDLPEPLLNTAAQASSVTTTTDNSVSLGTQSVGQEPNLISIVFSLLFVILLIYITGIIYAKLNKLGLNTLKKQIGDTNNYRATVVSTTPLGGNKTLHVVELDGKRMLIGASVNSIHLIKDLGNYPPCEIKEGEFSKIEIPNIRIPKIEIPRIEIPGFTKVVSKQVAEDDAQASQETQEETSNDSFEFSEIYEEENSDGIIDELFKTTTDETKKTVEDVANNKNEHSVDPDEFVLYKKYLS